MIDPEKTPSPLSRDLKPLAGGVRSARGTRHGATDVEGEARLATADEEEDGDEGDEYHRQHDYDHDYGIHGTP